MGRGCRLRRVPTLQAPCHCRFAVACSDFLAGGVPEVNSVPLRRQGWDVAQAFRPDAGIPAVGERRHRTCEVGKNPTLEKSLRPAALACAGVSMQCASNPLCRDLTTLDGLAPPASQPLRIRQAAGNVVRTPHTPWPERIEQTGPGRPCLATGRMASSPAGATPEPVRARRRAGSGSRGEKSRPCIGKPARCRPFVACCLPSLPMIGANSFFENARRVFMRILPPDATASANAVADSSSGASIVTTRS